MKKLLVANRGEIARRVMHSARRLGIATVAVHSDADAHAPHVREATQAVRLAGEASADTYLRIDRLIEAAQSSGADVVHPGYGFLSENADFAQAVIDAGLIWVGPPPAATRALGSKSGAKALALAHGVPTLPGYQGADQSDERFVAEAQKLGFPLMVKATAGGGGRGMRLVHEAAALLTALQSARAEALSGFGNDELLIERALLNPRHVEIQVFADAHGHCIHLGERDCSMQRRNQKIIEEAPSPAVHAELRAQMGQAAVALALAAGYQGAGTVEFLLEGGAFYLMEMNTRLQVEHCVTEQITGLDLVEWQLRVARGERLPLTQAQVQFNGHAMEVRLCSEDESFVPHTGRVSRLALPAHVAFERSELNALRADAALHVGSEVSPHYDSMLGKLIVHAASRAECMQQLRAALANSTLLGLPTNRAFLMACLEDATFQKGEALVPFLTQAAPGLAAQCIASEAALLPFALAAWGVLTGAPCAPTRLAHRFAQPLRVFWRGQTVDFQVQRLGAAPDGEHLMMAAAWGDEELETEAWVQALAGGSVQVLLHGGRTERLVAAPAAQGVWHLHGTASGADIMLTDQTYAPPEGADGAAAGGAVKAPFNGKVVALPVAAGSSVKKGDTLVVIESMKLQHHLASAIDGTLAELKVELGQQVAPQQVLALVVPA